MEHRKPVDDAAVALDPNEDRSRGDGVHEVTDDIAYKRLMLVNVVYAGASGAGDGNWVLIDAGIPGNADHIRESARLRFGGEGRPPPSS